MIDMSRLFHIGVRVADIDAAMAEMTEHLGLSWATVQHDPTRALWTPDEGTREVPLSYVYSVEGPTHVELVQGPSGSVWAGDVNPGTHHLGVWSDDVVGETDACLAAGWTMAAAGAGPDQGYGGFTYVVPPSGMIVELVAAAAQPRFEAWWAGGTLGRER